MEANALKENAQDIHFDEKVNPSRDAKLNVLCEKADKLWRAEKFSEAVVVYEKLVALGEPHGMYMLYRCYSEGKGVKSDFPRALGFLERRANLGYIFTKVDVGDIYYKGKDVKKDIPKALRLWQEVIVSLQGGEGLNALTSRKELLKDVSERIDRHGLLMKGKTSKGGNHD